MPSCWHSYSIQLYEWCHLHNSDSQFAPITFKITEIINGEKHYLGPLHNQMKREPKRRLVKFFRSFTTEVIKNIIGLLLHFISWDGCLYMEPGRVRFQGEVEVSFDSLISCTWRVIFLPYLRHLCLVLDGIR